MIETYTFQHGATTYTYTSEDDAISRGAITSSMVSTGEVLQIDVPRDNAVALLFRHYPPSARVSVTITATGLGQIWAGYVQQVRWHGSSATLECVDELATTVKLLNPHRFSRNCRHILYGQGCGVDPDSVDIPVNILRIDTVDRVIQVSVSGLTSYIGGAVIQGDSRAQIVDAQGDVLTIAMQDGAFSNGAAQLLPGCDHTAQTCKNIFNNIQNFGGFPAIKSSPFFTDLSGPDVED